MKRQRDAAKPLEPINPRSGQAEGVEARNIILNNDKNDYIQEQNNCQPSNIVNIVHEFRGYRNSNFSGHQPLDDFRQAMQDKIGYAPETIIPDGEIHRFSTKDNHTDKAGYYALFKHGKCFYAGFAGNWRTNSSISWHSKIKGKEGLTSQDKRIIAKAKQKATADKEQVHNRAAEKADNIWRNAKPASKDHPYLRSKGISPGQIKSYNNQLVIPVQEFNGKISSLQFINEDGSKRFLPGGKVSGRYYPIRGSKQKNSIFIVEGFATGRSVYEALDGDCTVIVAFDSGNLPKVAKEIRRKFPNRRIIIVADNDHNNVTNIGLNAGMEAAKQINASIVWPEFSNSEYGTDFNDLEQLKGKEHVKLILNQAVNFKALINPEPWPDIIPLSAYNTPKISTDMLPGFAGAYAAEIAETIQVPEELAVCVVLGALSTCVMNCAREISVRKDYTETLNLYLISCLMPAERKTAAKNAAFNAIYKWSLEKAELMKREIMLKKSERQSLERLIEKKRSALSKIKDPDKLNAAIEEIANDELNLPEIPAEPRLIIDDCTPEKLAQILAICNEIIALVSSEGGIFDTIAGRYSNGMCNLDLFLKAYCGEEYTVSRVNRDTITLHSPRMTICLCPQNDVIESLSSKKGFRGRGFIARFLYFMPQSMLGYRKVDTRPMAEEIVGR